MRIEIKDILFQKDKDYSYIKNKELVELPMPLFKAVMDDRWNVVDLKYGRYGQRCI